MLAPRSIPAATLAAYVLLGLLFCAFILAYQRATPLGEAPDEPAHLAYVRVILEGGLPPIPSQPGDLTYELHQPPLAYGIAAGWLRVGLGEQAVDAVPELPRSPTFDFSRPPKRYVAESARRPGASWARSTQLFWAALFLFAFFVCAFASTGSIGPGLDARLARDATAMSRAGASPAPTAETASRGDRRRGWWPSLDLGVARLRRLSARTFSMFASEAATEPMRSKEAGGRPAVPVAAVSRPAALRLGDGGVAELRIAVFSAFLFSPQLIFAFATFNNDASVIALSTLALALILGSDLGFDRLIAAALVAAAALWAKLSAAFLAAPLLLLAWRRRRVAPAGLWLAGSLALVLTQAARSPTSGSTGGFLALFSWQLPAGRLADLLEPGWLLTLGASFWAKLGWFNVSLPAAGYLLFLVPSALAVVGAVSTLRSQVSKKALTTASVRPAPGLLSLLAVLAISGLLLIFLLRVDWQPQGRLLLPAVGALAHLAAIGAETLTAGWSPGRRRLLALGLVAGAVFAARLGHLALRFAYV